MPNVREAIHHLESLRGTSRDSFGSVLATITAHDFHCWMVSRPPLTWGTFPIRQDVDDRVLLQIFLLVPLSLPEKIGDTNGEAPPTQVFTPLLQRVEASDAPRRHVCSQHVVCFGQRERERGNAPGCGTLV